MIQYISKSFKWFFKLEAASGLVLLFSAVLALILPSVHSALLYVLQVRQFTELMSRAQKADAEGNLPTAVALSSRACGRERSGPLFLLSRHP